MAIRFYSVVQCELFKTIDIYIGGSLSYNGNLEPLQVANKIDSPMINHRGFTVCTTEHWQKVTAFFNKLKLGRGTSKIWGLKFPLGIYIYIYILEGGGE